METCYFCKGTVLPQTVRHVHRWGEKIMIFDDVQAEVCQQCGEVYLAPDVLDMIDRATLEQREPKYTLTIPVFSLREMMTAAA